MSILIDHILNVNDDNFDITNSLTNRILNRITNHKNAVLMSEAHLQCQAGTPIVHRCLPHVGAVLYQCYGYY